MSSGEIEDGNAPVRRTARARKVNSRFAGADIDESYRKLVGRITASNYSSDKNDKDPSTPCEDSLDHDSGIKVGDSLLKVVGRNEILLQKNGTQTEQQENQSAPLKFTTLKTIALKKVKKNKKDDETLSPYNEGKPLPSLIVKYRSSTESDTSEASMDVETEKKRKLENIPEHDEVESKLAEVFNMKPNEIPGSPFTGLDQNPPSKILLTNENKVSLPGKKLKILSLKIPTTDLQNQITGNQIVVQKSNPVELKVVKKDKTNKTVVKKKKVNKKPPAAPNCFSSDGEDDIPLNILMNKKDEKSKDAKKKFSTKLGHAVKKKKFQGKNKSDDMPLKKLLIKSRKAIDKVNKLNKKVTTKASKLHIINTKKGKIIKSNLNGNKNVKTMKKTVKKFPPSKQDDLANIVISVGGKEGDYACVVLDKSHLTLQAESKINAPKEQQNKYTYIEKCIVPGINQGLVLEADLPTPKKNKVSKSDSLLGLEKAKSKTENKMLKKDEVESTKVKRKPSLDNQELETKLKKKPSFDSDKESTVTKKKDSLEESKISKKKDSLNNDLESKLSKKRDSLNNDSTIKSGINKKDKKRESLTNYSDSIKEIDNKKSESLTKNKKDNFSIKSFGEDQKKIKKEDEKVNIKREQSFTSNKVKSEKISLDNDTSESSLPNKDLKSSVPLKPLKEKGVKKESEGEKDKVTDGTKVKSEKKNDKEKSDDFESRLLEKHMKDKQRKEKHKETELSHSEEKVIKNSDRVFENKREINSDDYESGSQKKLKTEEKVDDQRLQKENEILSPASKKALKKESFEDMLAKELDDRQKLKAKLKKDDKKHSRSKSDKDRNSRESSIKEKIAKSLFSPQKKLESNYVNHSEELKDSTLIKKESPNDKSKYKSRHSSHSSSRKHREEDKHNKSTSSIDLEKEKSKGDNKFIKTDEFSKENKSKYQDEHKSKHHHHHHSKHKKHDKDKHRRRDSHERRHRDSHENRRNDSETFETSFESNSDCKNVNIEHTSEVNNKFNKNGSVKNQVSTIDTIKNEVSTESIALPHQYRSEECDKKSYNDQLLPCKEEVIVENVNLSTEVKQEKEITNTPHFKPINVLDKDIKNIKKDGEELEVLDTNINSTNTTLVKNELHNSLSEVKCEDSSVNKIVEDENKIVKSNQKNDSIINKNKIGIMDNENSHSSTEVILPEKYSHTENVSLLDDDLKVFSSHEDNESKNQDSLHLDHKAKASPKYNESRVEDSLVENNDSFVKNKTLSPSPHEDNEQNMKNKVINDIDIENNDEINIDDNDSSNSLSNIGQTNETKQTNNMKDEFISADYHIKRFFKSSYKDSKQGSKYSPVLIESNSNSPRDTCDSKFKPSSLPLNLIPLPGEVSTPPSEQKISEDSNEKSDESPESFEDDDIFDKTITDDKENRSPPCENKLVSKIVKELTLEEKEEIERRNKMIVEERMKSFEHLEENLHLVNKVKCKSAKEVRRMVCDCTLTKEEIANNEMGCGEDCINKLLMIECGSRCPLQEQCMNKNFQQKNYSAVEVFNAEEKGCGIRACEDILPGSFIMEYIGEVFDSKEFRRRRREYAKKSSAHFYFMALRSDRFIDATRKGNISRFINHSCSPNAETQKWTVNGEIRIGFFSTRHIDAGEEINFDYRLERYGREPQKCYCGTPECRGWLGESPDEMTKEEKEEERRKERDKKRREERRSSVEDIDLEDEIEKLNLHGLRNRQDTLNLSRLMVRALGSETRIKLLKMLETGEEACKRLFLDYHGLKLLWSWMADISSSQKCITLKLEILKTLSVLPITNKTQLIDSKVMNIVERWSKEVAKPKEEKESSNQKKEITSDKIGDASGESDSESPPDSKDGTTDPSPTDSISPDDSSQDSGETPKPDQDDNQSTEVIDEGNSLITTQKAVIEMAAKLLPIWNNLKEAFRIPRKQRVKMMKEHEREVDKEYKEYLGRKIKAGEERSQSLYDYDKWRKDVDRGRRDRRRERERERKRKRKKSWADEDDEGLSKEERRERFAQQVAKEDEEARQRKLQEEMWNLHLERCALLGHDPYFTPIFDPSGQFYWDPTSESWQSYIGPDGNLPVPAAYGVNQMMMPGAFFPPHPSGLIGDPSLQGQFPPMGDGVDPSSIPLPGELPLPKDPPVGGSLAVLGETDISGVDDQPQGPPALITIVLPPNWKMARDEKKVYFYHTKTRYTQWTIPSPDLHEKLMSKYGLASDSSDSDTDSTSSNSEEFSSDEGEEQEEEEKETLIQKSNVGDEKMVRRIRGKKKRSEKLVQERVISPILFQDREAARKERKEAKERAREEARKERWKNYKNKLAGKISESKSLDDLLASPDDDDEDEDLQKLVRKYKLGELKQVKEKSKVRAATAMADNSDLARKIKDTFRARMATYIVSVLNPYRKSDCTEGRITNNDDFKYLARKLTHFVMVKELKQLPSVDGLDCSESVKHKTKEFVKKYMSKYGSHYKRDPNDTKEY